VTSFFNWAHARESGVGVSTPSTLWGLNGVPDRSARRLEQWLDVLAELTADEWIDIADRARSRDARGVSSACARVELAISAHELEVTAWFIRDLVETAVLRAHPLTLARSRRVRSQLAIARSATAWAALAHATAQWLAPSDHDLLLAPFSGARTQLADSDPVLSSALGPGSRSSSSVAIAGTRRTKTLPPPSRS
jgi:hypothetical protein